MTMFVLQQPIMVRCIEPIADSELTELHEGTISHICAFDSEGFVSLLEDPGRVTDRGTSCEWHASRFEQVK